jgi:hypothetical protein
MKPQTFPDMESAIYWIADELLAHYAPSELAIAAATMILRLTCHYSVSQEDGSVTVRGTMLSDPDIHF